MEALNKTVIKKEVKWTSEQEELLAEWAEKAKCYRWLHSRAEKKYRKRNYAFTIPVIILSTLTGTANFAMDTFVPEEHKKTAMAAVGSVNIFAGILSTLQNFLRYAELMESNRACEVLWSKFGRNIEVELALEPGRRKPAEDFMNICRSEYDGLIEQSPTIDDDIIYQFKMNFKNASLKKPDICNGLDKCTIYEIPKTQKVAKIMSSAVRQMRPEKTWKNITDNKLIHHKPPTKHVESHHENKREIGELANLGKVKLFKQKLSQESTSVVDQIKSAIVEDIETGKVEQGKEPDKEQGKEPDKEQDKEPDKEPEPEEQDKEPEPQSDKEQDKEPDKEPEPEPEPEPDESEDFLHGISGN